ncbi:MAG: peptidylprolyl isomerase [Bacteroidota bacterium]
MIRINQVFNSCLLLSLLFLTSFQPEKLKNNPEKDVYVSIETPYGTMKAVLYNDTPIHRENFVKNIKEKVYDNLLFHRVINEFMIQGGDPDSKNAKEGAVLGNGGLGYTIPAEFTPAHFHKKGALAAARTPDQVNPEKESSSSQFYVVQGKVYPDNVLTMMEERMNATTKNQIFNELLMKPEYSGQMAIVKEAVGKKDNAAIQKVYTEMEKDINTELDKRGKFTFSKEQRDTYTTVGGAPHLDGNYTVFGEVVEGLNIIDSIAKVEVDGNSRPKKDIKFKITLVE